MKLFPQEPSIKLYETMFNDQDEDYGRARLAKELTHLIDKLAEPTVLALDDHWGSGKSVFLKKWTGHYLARSKKNGQVVYLDAFEHDYISDPLVALISTVEERFASDKKSKSLDGLKKVGAKLARPAFNAALQVATFGAKQYLDEIGDAVVDIASGSASEVATTFWEDERAKRELVTKFKEHLSSLAQDDGPLIIVIDELDRCRPDFALAVLETIKHFFSVKNVHFILGVNGEALAASIQARYGAGIDGEKYLRKFIQLRFGLPKEVNRHSDASHLVRYAEDKAIEMELPMRLVRDCLDLCRRINGSHEIGFRDINRILSNVATLPESSNLLVGQRVILSVLLVSAALAPKFHQNFIRGTATYEDVLEFLSVSKEEIAPEVARKSGPAAAESGVLVSRIMFCLEATALQKGITSAWSRDEIAREFNHHGFVEDPTSIPRVLQRTYIDLFRL